MKKVSSFKTYSIYAFFALGVLFTGCKKDDDEVVPQKVIEEEVITDVKLIFTNDIPFFIN